MSIWRIGAICIALLVAAVVTQFLSREENVPSPTYPPSDMVSGIYFDLSTVTVESPGNRVRAPESDNWAVTWADDDHQYAVFGDGYGFGTTDFTRASNGVVRIEGDKGDYSTYDVFKTGEAAGGWDGKSIGILAIDTVLYMFRNGDGSGSNAFNLIELYSSDDRGRSWRTTGVEWRPDEFLNTQFFSPTFLQFGRAFEGARDEFVYIFAPERTESVDEDPWNVQIPGQIALIRVDRANISRKAQYEYFAGLDDENNAVWTPTLHEREPVFEDARNGVMRTSVSFNAGLGRYFLVTQQVSRFEADDYHIGIYEAPEPWGPWATVLFANPGEIGERCTSLPRFLLWDTVVHWVTGCPGSLNTGFKTVYWNFSNKWLSDDGRDFVFVYTGPGADEWGTVEGRFELTRDSL